MAGSKRKRELDMWNIETIRAMIADIESRRQTRDLTEAELERLRRLYAVLDRRMDQE